MINYDKSHSISHMFTPNSTFHSLCVKSVLRETWLPQNPAGSKWRWFQPALYYKLLDCEKGSCNILCQFPLGNLDTEHRVFLWKLSSGPEPSMSKPTQITMKRCIGAIVSTEDDSRCQHLPESSLLFSL